MEYAGWFIFRKLPSKLTISTHCLLVKILCLLTFLIKILDEEAVFLEMCVPSSQTVQTDSVLGSLNTLQWLSHVSSVMTEQQLAGRPKAADSREGALTLKMFFLIECLK